MEKQNKTTICLSDEIKENFNEWLKSWDFKINSADNRDNLQKATEGCKAIINLSSKICNDIERKYIKSALNGKLEGSNEYNEAYVKAIEKAESIETHKELQKINNLAFSLMYYIENLNELKNIRTKENFKLRAEYQNLKMKDFKLVHAYFVNKKLKDLSEEEFINHWENIFR